MFLILIASNAVTNTGNLSAGWLHVIKQQFNQAVMSNKVLQFVSGALPLHQTARGSLSNE